MRRYTTPDIRAFVTVPPASPDGLPGGDRGVPRITVVTPSYNQAGFLERTLRSVLNQDHPNLEYIVMDGGSTDGSVEIIRRYERHLAYWVSEKDAGHADALNKGFARGTGSIFAFLNSDDLYLPGALASVAAAFQADPRPAVVYGNTYRIDLEENILHEHRQTAFLPLGYLYGACDLQQPSVFWTADLFRCVGGIDTDWRFSFDTHLFFRFVAAGARFRFIRQFLSCFRVHPASKTATISHVGVEENARLRAEFAEFPVDSLPARWIRARARLGRMARYLSQCDAGWVARRLMHRAFRQPDA